MLKWLTSERLQYFTGITINAANANISKGIWVEGTHWRKAPNGRRFFHFEKIQDWIEGKTWQSSNVNPRS